MKGIETQASSASMLKRAIQGEAKKAGLSQPRCRARVDSGPEAILHDRFADHPAHGDRAQHEGQEERDAEELARPDLGIEQKCEAECDGVLDEHHGRVVDHVEERVPVIGVVEQVDEIVEAVEVRALEGAEVPVERSDVEAEERREDDDRDGEENRGQHEERLLPALAAHQHLREAEGDRPRDVGIEHRPPVGEAGCFPRADNLKGRARPRGRARPGSQASARRSSGRPEHAAPRSGSAGRRRAVTGSPSGVAGWISASGPGAAISRNRLVAGFRHQPKRNPTSQFRRTRLHAERCLVELDLLVAADLVGQLLPGGGDVVGALLGVVLAGEDLGELVFGHAVVLEDARDARLDRRVRVVVGVGLGLRDSW